MWYLLGTLNLPPSVRVNDFLKTKSVTISIGCSHREKSRWPNTCVTFEPNAVNK